MVLQPAVKIPAMLTPCSCCIPTRGHEATVVTSLSMLLSKLFDVVFVLFIKDSSFLFNSLHFLYPILRSEIS